MSTPGSLFIALSSPTAKVPLPHPHARLTVHGRRLLVERVRTGRPVTHVADEMGISRRFGVPAEA